MHIKMILLSIAFCTLTSDISLAQGAPVVKVCTMDKGFGNKTSPDGTGLWQTRFQQKFSEIPADVQYYPSPRARCIQDVKNHKADAIYAIYAADRARYLEFPKKADRNEVDVKKAIDVVNFHLYKHRDAKINWNGVNLTNVEDQKILVQQGIQVDKFQQLVRSDLIVEIKTVKQILDMLEKRRVKAAILAKEQVVELLKNETTLLISPQPVHTSHVFLAFDKGFYQKNTQLVEKIWTAIELVNSSTSLLESNP